MSTWEHADKLINNDIVYIFNEFEVYIDNNDTKVIDHLNEELHLYKDKSPLRNLTDGVKSAIFERKLNIPNSVNDRVYNKGDFVPSKYFAEFYRIKNKGVNIFKTCFFSETIREAISDKKVIHYTDINSEREECFVTFNDFKKNSSIRDLKIHFEQTFKHSSRIVVIVDTVLSRDLSENIDELDIKTIFIGRKDIFDELKSQVRNLEYYSDDCVQYFQDVLNYVVAYNSSIKIKQIISNPEITNKLIEINSNINPEEFNNLLEHSSLLNINNFPYVVMYILSYSNRKAFDLKRAFKHILSISNNKALAMLQIWATTFKENNISLLFSEELYNDLGIHSEENISLFFDIIANFECYEILDENESDIQKILHSYDGVLKELFSLKLLELIIKKDKIKQYAPFLLESKIALSKEIIEFYEGLINEKEINIPNVPEIIKLALIAYKENHEMISNSEWHHEDGYDYNFSSKAPFPSSFRYKTVFQDKITTFQEVRPFITNGVIYYIERNKVKIFDLFQKKAASRQFDESLISYNSYDSRLIYCTEEEVFMLDRNGDNINLDVIIDRNVFKNLRIRDGLVYYFNSPITLVAIPIETFMSGDASLYNEYDITVPHSINVIDMIILDDYAYWITEEKMFGVNLNNHETCEIALESSAAPRKLFTQNDLVFVLSEDSVYAYDAGKIRWLADMFNWNKYTCYKNYLILTHNSTINIINTDTGKQQLVASNLIEGAISDIICTRDQLIFVDYSGNIYTAEIVENSEYKNGIELSIKKVISVIGEKSLLAYFKKYLSIYNKQEFVIYSA